MGDFSFIWPVGERTAMSQMIRIHGFGISDLRPVWDKYIPYIRTRHRTTFQQQTSPFGQAWPPLSEPYATRKRAMYGTKPILVATGALKRAASVKGAAGQIFTMDAQSMTFGVALGKVYPGVHQRTERIRKDGTPIKRSWLGLHAPADLDKLRFYIAAHLRRLRGQATAIGRGRA